MSYLGYPFSTGVETIDYRVTDAYADPPGRSEEFYTDDNMRSSTSIWIRTNDRYR